MLTFTRFRLGLKLTRYFTMVCYPVRTPILFWFPSDRFLILKLSPSRRIVGIPLIAIQWLAYACFFLPSVFNKNNTVYNMLQPNQNYLERHAHKIITFRVYTYVWERLSNTLECNPMWNKKQLLSIEKWRCNYLVNIIRIINITTQLH